MLATTPTYWRTAAFALVLLLSGADAAAERVHVQTEEPRLLCVPPLALAPRCRDLPPGRFVDEGTWSALDAALRAAEDERTRLRAENGALRKSVQGWSPGWKTLLTTLVVGIAGGAYAARKL